jgi:hypothetical protein
MLREHHSFFLPNLLSLTNGNTYLGSFLGLRFRAKPDTDENTIACLVWYGEFCLEESTVVAEATFSLTEEGREQVIDWLEEQYEKMPKDDLNLPET